MSDDPRETAPQSLGLYASKYAFAPVFSAAFNTFVWLYVRPRISGVENLPGSGAYILAANHASHADTPIVFAAVPGRLRRRLVAAAADDYFFDGGLREVVARSLFNAIPIERKPLPGVDPLRHANRALREGYGLLLFPEGTRSRDGSVAPFRLGIGRLIAENPGVPVVPVWLDTAGKVLPKGKIVPRPYTVGVRFGAPLFLQAQPDDRASWRAAADAVRAALIALSQQPAPPRHPWYGRLPWRRPPAPAPADDRAV